MQDFLHKNAKTKPHLNEEEIASAAMNANYHLNEVGKLDKTSIAAAFIKALLWTEQGKKSKKQLLEAWRKVQTLCENSIFAQEENHSSTFSSVVTEVTTKAILDLME